MFKPITKEEREGDFADKLLEAYNWLLRGADLPKDKREAIRVVQDVWKRWGYYEGEVDGIWGPKTEKAYWRWREVRDIQWKINDFFGRDVVEVDGLYGRRTRNAVKKVQKKLKEMGLYKGKIDGIWGPLTEKAYQQWKASLQGGAVVELVEGKKPAPKAPSRATTKATSKAKERKGKKAEQKSRTKKKEQGTRKEEVRKKAGKETAKEGKMGEETEEVELAPEVKATVVRLAEEAVKRGKEKLGAELPVLVFYVENPRKGGGKAYLYKDGKIVAEMPLSFSRQGLGFTIGSGKTPAGLLFVNTSSKPIKGIVKVSSVTKTPIFNTAWAVEGLERENQNSARRKIAFHGTTEYGQGLVGKRPLSAGCYTARYKDLLRLYKEAGTTADGRRGFLLVVYSPKGPTTSFIEEALGSYAEVGGGS